MTRPFDEEAAKAGAPVQTKDGRKVRILCYDRACELFPIVGLVTEFDGVEHCCSWTPQGSIDLSWADKSDLVMVPIKKGWINLSPGKEPIVGGPVYATKEEANARTSPHIIQEHIEWRNEMQISKEQLQEWEAAAIRAITHNHQIDWSVTRDPALIIRDSAEDCVAYAALKAEALAKS